MERRDHRATLDRPAILVNALLPRPFQHALLFLALLLLAGCENLQPEQKQDELTSGFWHARIKLPGGDIETGIELSHSPGGYVANLINGQ